MTARGLLNWALRREGRGTRPDSARDADGGVNRGRAAHDSNLNPNLTIERLNAGPAARAGRAGEKAGAHERLNAGHRRVREDWEKQLRSAGSMKKPSAL